MSTSRRAALRKPDPRYDGPGEIMRETGVRLAAVLPKLSAEILYVYDLGDYWQHDVRLEAAFPAESGVKVSPSSRWRAELPARRLWRSGVATPICLKSS